MEKENLNASRPFALDKVLAFGWLALLGLLGLLYNYVQRGETDNVTARSLLQTRIEALEREQGTIRTQVEVLKVTVGDESRAAAKDMDRVSIELRRLTEAAERSIGGRTR